MFKLVFSLYAAGLHAKIAAASKNSLYTMSGIRDIELAVRDPFLQPLFNSRGLVNMAYFSGLVVGWRIFPLARKNATFSYGSQVLQKIFKVMPGLACLIAIEFLWPFVGSGPLYTWEAEDVVHDCTNSWWRVLTFIVNFSPAMENCVNHTFYSAIDMQLFVLGMIAVFLTTKSVKLGIRFSLLMICIDFAMTAYVTHYYDLGPILASHPIDVGKVLTYIDKVHYKTFEYLGSYFIGYLIGIYLSSGKAVGLGKKFLWLGAAIFFLSCFLPAIYNSYDDLVPKWTVPYCAGIIKIIFCWAMTLVTLSTATKSSQRSTSAKKTREITRDNNNVENMNEKPRTNFLIGLKRLSTAIYLTNYWFVRWDFFSSRVLLENRPFAFLRRMTYSVIFAVLLAFVFHLVFLAPIEYYRKKYFNGIKSEESRVKKTD